MCICTWVGQGVGIGGCVLFMRTDFATEKITYDNRDTIFNLTFDDIYAII